jgi:hypothetical protein
MARLLFDRSVLLMLENRSFDHLFGYLRIGDGIPQRSATNYLKPDDATSEKFVSRKGDRRIGSCGSGPAQQDTKRTQHITNRAQAKQFVRVQMAKRLEHNIASGGKPLPTASAYNELPSPMVSPARIAELRRPARPPGTCP